MDNGEEVRVTSTTGAQKGSKLARYDLIPCEPLNELAKVYGRGASKYQDRNWEAGYDWSLSFAALMRHAWAFWNGEDTDPELGTPHMANVAWHAFVLIEFMRTHPEFDNRASTVRNRREDEKEAEIDNTPAFTIDLLPVRDQLELMGTDNPYRRQ